MAWYDGYTDTISDMKAVVGGTGDLIQEGQSQYNEIVNGGGVENEGDAVETVTPDGNTVVTPKAENDSLFRDNGNVSSTDSVISIFGLSRNDTLMLGVAGLLGVLLVIRLVRK